VVDAEDCPSSEEEKIGRSFLLLYYALLNHLQDNKIEIQKKQQKLNQLQDLFTPDAVFTCQGQLFRGAWIPPTLSQFLSSQLNSYHFVPISISIQPSYPQKSILVMVEGQAQLPAVLSLDVDVNYKELEKKTRIWFSQIFMLVPKIDPKMTKSGYIVSNSFFRFG